MCQEFKLGSNRDVVSSGIALGFAGGIGSAGSVCGAVADAVMRIGLRLGRGHSIADMLSRSGMVREFRRRFEVEMEHITCRELTGMDLTTQEGRVKFIGSEIPQKVCLPAVGTAYLLVVDLLKETLQV